MERTNQTAIVTGASGQLGSEIALSLAAGGMHCLCHYHTNEAAAAKVADSIRQMGQKTIAVQADLSDPDAANMIFDKAYQLPPVRVLINSASIFRRQPLGTFDAEDISQVMSVNLTAPIMLCNVFASYLKEQGVTDSNSGQTVASIINMVDVGGVKPWAQFSPYCASRAGLIGLTKSLAKELAPAVTVNAIAPGIVTWPGKMDPAEEAKQLAMIPAGRFGEPKDITRTINFLLENNYITGQTICVDGGRSI